MRPPPHAGAYIPGAMSERVKPTHSGLKADLNLYTYHINFKPLSAGYLMQTSDRLYFKYVLSRQFICERVVQMPKMCVIMKYIWK